MNQLAVIVPMIVPMVVHGALPVCALLGLVGLGLVIVLRSAAVVNVTMAPANAPEKTPPLRPGSVLVDVEGSAVRSGGFRAIQDVDLPFVPGEVVAVIGQNGAGRTTFVEALSGTADRHRADQLLASVGLTGFGHRHPPELSSRPQKRAEWPRLLILEEPFDGLHPAERERLASHLRRLRAEGVGVVVIDHVLDDLLAVADQVVAVDFGQLVGQGGPETIPHNACFGPTQQTLVKESL